MKIIIPLFHADQVIPKQFTRFLNGKMSFLYLVESVCRAKLGLQVEVWTDIKEIYIRLQKFNEITARLLNGKEHVFTLCQSEQAFIVNSYLLLLSPESLRKGIDELSQEPQIVTAHNEWIFYFGNASSFFDESSLEKVKKKSVDIPRIEVTSVSNKLGWWIAEKEVQKKRIIIHPKSSSKIGMGHVYRGLTIASRLISDHEILFVFQKEQNIGIELVKSEGYEVKTYSESAIPIVKEFKADVIINDLLNTSKEYMLELRKLNCRIVNFEDQGEGAELADAVINALYPGDVPRRNFYTGQKFYCIREDFLDVEKKEVGESVQEILLTFGGADPQNLTLRTLRELVLIQNKYKFDIRVILGPAYQKHDELYAFIKDQGLVRGVFVHEVVTEMAQYMSKADIIFTSAGRTMYEIATIGTPAIVIAQNYRELTHTFGHPYNGFYDLGYWAELAEGDYAKAAVKLIENYQLRKLMNNRMMSIDLTKGIERVTTIILGEGATDGYETALFDCRSGR